MRAAAQCGVQWSLWHVTSRTEREPRRYEDVVAGVLHGACPGDFPPEVRAGARWWWWWWWWWC